MYARHQCLLADNCGCPAESLCIEVAQQVLSQYGKTLTPEAQRAALGKRPLDCWRDVARVLQLDVSAQTLFDETEPLLSQR